jgi:propionyl-CoA synthetase
MRSEYDQVFRESIENPERFWSRAAEEVRWFHKYETVLQAGEYPFYKWFKGGIINTCFNALDRHIEEGNGSRIALIHDSAITRTIKKYSYAELHLRVSDFGGALTRHGIGIGDRVIIYMPMIPEAVIAMLACSRIGAIHSVVFGGFAAQELANRIDDSQAKLVLSASCGLEPGRVVPYQPLLAEALRLAKHKAVHCVIFQREQHPADLAAGDIDWEVFVKDAPGSECAAMDANDPAYILYTSGTTGAPKGVVRDIAGHIVALKWSMRNIYGVNPGDVWWSASDIGWVVGHSYIVYGPLFHGCTTILFEGKPVGTPDAGVFWRVISEHRVKTLFTAPTALRAIKRDDPAGEFVQRYDLSGFNSLYLAGERVDPDTLKWAERLLGKPVIDHWWQTETGWPISANCAGLGLFPTKYGSAGKPVPGFDVRVLGPDGKEAENGRMGDVVVKLPLPPGAFPTLWNAAARYRADYMSKYPGYYQTYDAGYIDEDGYVWIMSRTDDVINVAGHRLSTGALEEVLAAHQDVAECAVLGIADPVKGQLPIGLLVLKSGVIRRPDEISRECVGMVREKIGPVASFKTAIVVQRLPKTKSGKILRGTIRKIADNQAYKVPATIDDPQILEEIRIALITHGLIRN